jgi:hypothetical protein
MGRLRCSRERLEGKERNIGQIREEDVEKGSPHREGRV